jgi:peptidyl-prolyl cis-trans isomerase SurA
MKTRWLGLVTGLVLFAGGLLAQDKGHLVEEIIARVNNEIITRSDLGRAAASLHDEVKQDCHDCTPAQVEVNFKEREKDALRDLIDQSLLVQKAKDDGISVETEVIKRLDAIRQQNNFTTMEALEKAVEDQGVGWEDYKAGIRNNLLTQEVIRKEVGSHIQIDRTEVQKFYQEHKDSFVRPEQVYLREIFVSTDGKSPSEIPALEAKASQLLDRVKKGEDFGEMAKHYSGGSTAKDGGDLGAFERGQLSKELEDAVFKLDRDGLTDVIRTKQGFEVLQVREHYKAGQQPLEKVEDEITNRLYMHQMQPALRVFLKTLREQSYVIVKPGYIDTAAVASAPILETAPTPDKPKGKKGKSKKRASG